MSLLFKAALLLKRWELSRNGELSRAQLQAKQLSKFRALVAYTNRKSSYYAEIIRSKSIDIKSCVPEDFPVLTKTEVMANFDNLVTDRRITKKAVSAFLEESKNPANLFLDRFHVVHTSGSSGEVGVFVFSNMDWARGFAQVGRNNPLPSPFKPLRYACFFAADGHYAGASWASTLRSLSVRRAENILIIDINTPLVEVTRKLNDFQPDVLGGYPSGTLMLAAQQCSGALVIRPSKIILSGEVATALEIRSIANAFKSSVVNSYNCSEHMAMGATLPDSPSIRLWEDDLIFEIQEHQTIITNLFNWTMPLI